uniref:Uncharacterized protein n=1 Tax=Siphoviridae sp. ctGuJ10 TaxID=2825418 RepID=A0A8S5PUE1_9CAUD|nr:MAG TPA: hypothetical protein [Siphoviridae sp. ctGuJ10]
MPTMSDKEKIEKAYDADVCILCASKERARELETKSELQGNAIEAIAIRSLIYNHQKYSDHLDAEFVIDDLKGILSALGIYEVD